MRWRDLYCAEMQVWTSTKEFNDSFKEMKADVEV